MIDPQEGAKKAFDFAADAIKQVLTLSTAIIGGAIAIFRNPDRTGIDLGPHAGWILAGLWLMVASTAFALATLNNLAGTLERPPATGSSIYKPSIQLFWIAQIAFFLLGLAALAWAASSGVPISKDQHSPPDHRTALRGVDPTLGRGGESPVVAANISR